MVLVTGCSTLEHGNIADPEPVEVYYYKTTYVQQPFAVLLATEMDDGTVRVVFSTDAEVNFEGGFYSPDIEPNHLLVKNYKKDDYLSSSFDNDKYERGANYLIRLLLLNKCDYLISSLTNGSLFLKLICDKKYEDEHWFELGKY